MVFLKPQIITDAKMMNSMAKEKYNFIRADQLRKQEEGLSLMRDENLPMLPKWSDKLVLPPSFEEYQESIQAEKNNSAKENDD
jgi:general secretion pathway protein D